MEKDSLPFSFTASYLTCEIEKSLVKPIISNISFKWCIHHDVLSSYNIPISDYKQAIAITHLLQKQLTHTHD